jgi:hypothetical protein
MEMQFYIAWITIVVFSHIDSSLPIQWNLSKPNPESTENLLSIAVYIKFFVLQTANPIYPGSSYSETCLNRTH